MKKSSKFSLLILPLLFSMSLFSCESPTSSSNSISDTSKPIDVNSSNSSHNSSSSSSNSSSTTTKPVEKKEKLTIITPDGISISPDYVDEFIVGNPIILPSENQVIGLGTKEIIGYFIIDTDDEIISGETLMIKGGLTVEMRVKETVASLTIINNTEAELETDYQTEFKIGEAITLPNVVSLPIGYELDGFYIQGTDEKAVSGQTIMPEDGLTLELRLTALIKVTIHFASQLHEDIEIYVKAGSTIDLDEYDITDDLPANYEFDHWHGSDENGDIIINEENEVVINSDTEIWFAVKIAKRTVELILPDGVTVKESYKREYEVGIQTVKAPLSSEVVGIPEGQEIDGWYYKGELYDGKTIMPLEGMTLELRLKAMECTVTLNLTIPNSKVTISDDYPTKQTCDYGKAIALPKREQLSGIAEDARIEWYVNDTLCESDDFIVTEKKTTISLKVYVKAKFILPSTITVSEELTQAEYQAGQSIPFINDITSYIQIDESETRTIDTWYYQKADGTQAKATKYVKIPASGLILMPTFLSKGTPLIPGKNSAKDIPDRFGHYSDDLKTFTSYDDSDASLFSPNDAIVDGESGRIFNHSGTLAINDAFRLNTMTESGVTSDKHYRVYYHLKNCGETELSFDLYQINSKTDILSSNTSVKYPDTITLAKDETISLSIEFTGYDNNNLLSMIVMKKEVINMRLGIAMSFEEFTPTIDPSIKYTLTLSEKDDITFADGSKTAELAQGETLPEIINNTGRIIEGYHSDDKIFDEFTMPNQDITIAPHYINNGYRRMWYGDGKEDGIPDKLSGGVSADNFVKLRDPLTQSDPSIYGDIKDVMKTIVNGGGNGFAQQGVLMQYNSTMKTGGAFRNSIVVNDKSDTSGSQFKLEKDKTYTYNFNFENKGDSDIAFQVTFVNNGVDKTSTGEDNTFKVELAKGESMTITCDVSYLTFYSGSTNDNANLLFEALSDMTDIKLGIAMSIKIPE